MKKAPGATAASGEVAVEFVIRGKVQGVFFRKHTHAKASELQLKGDVRNESDGSVKGYIQGPAAAVQSMKMCVVTCVTFLIVHQFTLTCDADG
jgi:acylphosphatase